MVQFRHMSSPIEDLPSLAATQFDVALKLCGECRPYHALWGYLRLARQVGGVEADEPHLAQLLRDLLGSRSTRILIAGSADSGVTAMMNRAASATPWQHEFTVVDRCLTPLKTCEAFATRHGISLRTVQGDLREVSLDGPFDLIIGHSVLQFFDPSQRLVVLAALRHQLAHDGRLLLVSRLAASDGAAAHRAREPHEWARTLRAGIDASLAEQGQPLPCTSSDWDELIQAYVRRNAFHVSPHDSEEGLRNELEQSGLVVEHLMPVGNGMAFGQGGQVNRTARRGLVVIARSS